MAHGGDNLSASRLLLLTLQKFNNLEFLLKFQKASFLKHVNRRSASSCLVQMPIARYVRAMIEQNATGSEDNGISAYAHHPFADLFPMIDGEPFEALVASIKNGGLREPITIHEDQILDGRNRYRACVRAGVKPHFESLSENESPLQFVVDRNLHRRHLNESQRAIIAAKVSTMRQGQRTDLEHSANLQKVGRASAAKLMNVSERTAASAAKVCAEGTPELIAAVQRGATSVSAAADSRCWMVTIDPVAGRMIPAPVRSRLSASTSIFAAPFATRCGVVVGAAIPPEKFCDQRLTY